METAKIDVCIFTFNDESISLFKGGEHLPRFGGAGLHMYLLAQELQKNPRYTVHFLFLENAAQGLDGEGLDLISIHTMRHLIKHGLPYIARPINKAQSKAPYKKLGTKRVFISTMALGAPILKREAGFAGAKTIFQTASETDVTAPRGRGPAVQKELLDTIAGFDVVAVQTELQRENLLKTRNRDSVVIRKGMPAPPQIPPYEKKDGVLWVASGQPLKQPWIFLDLARAIPEECFTMIMPPAEQQLYEYVQRQAQDLPNLTLIDKQVPYKETQRYFDEAKLFIYTSEFGSDPAITVLQAGLGGCAIVSHALDPDEQMFSRCNTGIVGDNSMSTLITNVQELLSSPSRQQTLGKNAFDYVKRTYSLAAMANAYTELIDSLFPTT